MAKATKSKATKASKTAKAPAKKVAKGPTKAAPAKAAKATKAGSKAAPARAAKGTKPASNAAPAKAAKAAPATEAAPGGPKVVGDGTSGKPWKLTTPPGSSAFVAYRDPIATPPALVCKVGSTTLSYQLRCIDDLHAMLKAHGDWMPLGGADEQKPASDGTVEAWGRSAKNPVGGWYGLKKGFRGRFGVYVPPVLEALGLAEVEHGARNNRMRAK
jgi:hypothetical protein